jgi:predicted RNA-binding Zn-ribbon protein involved in translation (DUF1610 family)
MDIKVTCPSCGQRLVVDSTAVGQQTNCPTCSTAFVVPAVARTESSPLATPPDTRRRGAAISSLVLGILSLLCFGILTGIPAIILGHKAHTRARRLPAQYAGGGMAIAGFILGYIGSLVMVALMVAFVGFGFIEKAKMDEAPIINSENNLKEIGVAFRLWAGDNNDQFPFNVSQAQGGTRELCDRDSAGFEKNPVPIFMAMSNVLSIPEILVCRNDKTKQAAADFASLTTNNISYQLRTGTNVSLENPEEILAVDPINGIVLRCDGSVERDFHYKKAVPNQ